MLTMARETTTNAVRIIWVDGAGANAAWSSRRAGPGVGPSAKSIGAALKQAAADAPLPPARLRHFFHAINLRRLLAQRESNFAFASGAPDAQAHGFAGRPPAEPASELARH